MAKDRDETTGKFLPGWKGGGRPPIPPELKQACQLESLESLKIVKQLRDHAESEQVRLNAALAIWDRAWGKPCQPTDSTLRFEQMSDDEVQAKAREIATRIASGGHAR